jgi:hypothetical protein
VSGEGSSLQQVTAAAAAAAASSDCKNNTHSKSEW